MLSYALEDRTPLPVLKALLPAVFLLIALVLPPHPFRSYVFLPSIALLSLQTPLRYTTGSPGGDFGLGTGIYLLFLALDRLENGTEMLRDGYEAGEHEPIPVETFERIGYAFKLCASMRGAGWNWRVKGTPIETSSRGSFILDRVLRVSFAYLAIDALSTYCRSTLYFTQQVPLGDVKGLDLVLHLLAAGSLGAAAITLLYHSVCLLGVLTFVYSPAECPLLFGSLASASTLRSFWGKTWHQSFRRTFAGLGVSLSSKIGLQPLSPLHNTLVLTTAFVCSAFQHAFAIYAVNRQGRKTAQFFLLQIPGILLETSMHYSPIQLPKPIARTLGYVWTTTFLLATFSLFMSDLVDIGLWQINLAPFSIVNGLLHGTYWLE